jgi:hypothetical protein
MSAQRKPVYLSTPDFEACINDVYDRLDGLEFTFEKMLEKLISEFAAERKEVRTRILEDASSLAQPNSPCASPQTTPHFLTFRFRDGLLDLYWVETHFTSTPGKRIYRRIKLESGDFDMRALLQHAHPDEVETIRRQEMRARLIRKQYREYVEIRTKMKSFLDAHIGAT